MDLQFSIGEALGTDYFGLREPFTQQQEDYLVKTRQFVDTDVLPIINDYWERAEFPWPLIEKMSALNIFGDGIKGYGCPDMDPMSVGLVNMELNRGDGSQSGSSYPRPPGVKPGRSQSAGRRSKSSAGWGR